MGLEIKTQTTVDATRERVFAYLADFGRHPEWAQPKDQLRINAPREVRAGATFTSIGKDRGRDAKNTVTIAEVVPGERIVYVATQDNGTTWRNILELADANGGTRITRRVSSVSAKFPFNVLLVLLAPMLKVEAAKIHASDLARIKSRLEQSAKTEAAR